MSRRSIFGTGKQLSSRSLDRSKAVMSYLGLRHAYAFMQISFLCALLVISIVASVRASSPVNGSQASNGNSLGTTKVTNANNVPQAGQKLKFGIYTDSNSIQANVKELGTKPAIIAWFKQWNSDLGSGKLSYVCSQGYVPMITWESWGGAGVTGNNSTFTLDDIASGKYDALIKQNIQHVKDVCGSQTVIIRFDHEMDTPPGVPGWYPWQDDPQAYIAAWQHIVGLARPIDPSIKWLWSPNRGNAIAQDYYPGDQWVDYVGLTLNHGTLETQYSTFTQFYADNQAVIESYGKPIIIGETTSDETLGGKAAWVTDMFNFAHSDKNIVGIVWFNGSPAYQFDSSQTSLNAFRQALSSSPKN